MTLKKTFFLLLFCCFVLNVKAQYTRGEADTAKVPTKPAEPAPPKAYLGIGTGFNSYVGVIGVGVNFRVYQTLFL